MIFLRSSFLLTLLMGFLLLGIGACVDYKEVKVRKVRVKRIEGKEKGKMDITLSVTVNNPNDYKIKMVGSEVDLMLSGEHVGAASLKEKVTLPANSEKTHRVLIATSYQKMLESAGPAFANMLQKGTVDLQVKGTVRGKAFGLFGRTHEVNYKQSIDLNPDMLLNPKGS